MVSVGFAVEVVKYKEVVMSKLIVTVRQFDPCYGFGCIPAGTLLFATQYKGIYRLHDSNMDLVGTCSDINDLI